MHDQNKALPSLRFSAVSPTREFLVVTTHIFDSAGSWLFERAMTPAWHAHLWHHSFGGYESQLPDVTCTALHFFHRTDRAWYRKLKTSADLVLHAVKDASRWDGTGRQQSDCTDDCTDQAELMQSWKLVMRASGEGG